MLCSLAEPGDTLLDIGANIGYVSASFLTGVPGSTLVSVEPQPGVVDLLKRNLDGFGHRATVYPYALSDRDGTAFFHVEENDRGASRLSNAGTAIEIRSADSLFRDAKLNRLDLVKIDVEGHEEEVIRSCFSHFKRLQPKAILFEEQSNKSAGIIGEMLRDAGYEINALKKKLTRLEFVPVRSAADCVSNDYIAIRRS